MENLYTIIAELNEEGYSRPLDVQVLFIGTKEKVDEVYEKIKKIQNSLCESYKLLNKATDIQREDLQKLYTNWPTSVEYKEKLQDLVIYYNRFLNELQKQFEYFNYYIYITENKNIIF